MMKTKENKKMNAMKCDRCGAYYEMYNGGKLEKYGNGIDIVKPNGEINTAVSHCDLCPACMRKLANFLEFYKYISGKLGRQVHSHELADPNVTKEIKTAAEADFKALCLWGEERSDN